MAAQPNPDGETAAAPAQKVPFKQRCRQNFSRGYQAFKLWLKGMDFESLEEIEKSTDKEPGTIALNWKVVCEEDKALTYRAPKWTDRVIHKFQRFYVHPSSDRYYYWTGIVGFVYLYNVMIPVARWTFIGLQDKYFYFWLITDYITDMINIMDIFVQSRKAFLENGLLVTNVPVLTKRYICSKLFLMDLIAVIPTDIIFFANVLSWDECWIRFNRFLRYRRMNEFTEATDNRTTWPNLFRISKMIITIFVMFHWNACAWFTIGRKVVGLGQNEWVFTYDKIRDPGDCFPEEDQCSFNASQNSYFPFGNLTKQYVFSIYWSALILTTIGEQDPPVTVPETGFVIFDILIGLFIFSSILGNVGAMVTNANAAQTEFQEYLDGVKQYMKYRKVNPQLQQRVIDWFNYVWEEKNTLDEEAATEALPTKLKSELAIAVHMDTLKRVNLFKDAESGLLIELMLKLQLQTYSPGDYICRKGDIGKEMYIIKQGALEVVSEDGKKVFVTLKEGSVLGELSLLNIPGSKNGNRRSASIRSVGYTDLFVLSKDDLMEALREYPEAKKLLLQKAREMLRKDNLLVEGAEDLDPEDETLEGRLDRMIENFKQMLNQVDTMYLNYNRETADIKKRLTACERAYQERRAPTAVA